MEATLRVGLIGAGGIGRYLAYQAKGVSEITLTGVYDANPELTQSAAQELEIPAYPTLSALLEDEGVQAVIVATPPYTHRELCEQALQAGKHVFLEKPMALSVADCDAILQAAERTQRRVMVGHVLRLFPLFYQAKQWLDAGVIGKPLAVAIRRTGNERELFAKGWRADVRQSGGLLMEMNVHELDYLRWLLGTVRVVAAQGIQPFAEPNFIQHWHALFVSETGAVAQIEAGMIDPLGSYRVSIIGEQGTIEHTGFGGTVRYKTHSGEEQTMTPEEINTPEPYQWELRLFARGVLFGEPLPYDGTDGREAVALAEACLQKMNTRQEF